MISGPGVKLRDGVGVEVDVGVGVERGGITTATITVSRFVRRCIKQLKDATTQKWDVLHGEYVSL